MELALCTLVSLLLTCCVSWVTGGAQSLFLQWRWGWWWCGTDKVPPKQDCMAGLLNEDFLLQRLGGQRGPCRLHWGSLSYCVRRQRGSPVLLSAVCSSVRCLLYAGVEGLLGCEGGRGTVGFHSHECFFPRQGAAMPCDPHLERSALCPVKTRLLRSTGMGGPWPMAQSF